MNPMYGPRALKPVGSPEWIAQTVGVLRIRLEKLMLEVYDTKQLLDELVDADVADDEDDAAIRRVIERLEEAGRELDEMLNMSVEERARRAQKGR